MGLCAFNRMRALLAEKENKAPEPEIKVEEVKAPESEKIDETVEKPIKENKTESKSKKKTDAEKLMSK